jgi:hypothetical protein
MRSRAIAASPCPYKPRVAVHPLGYRAGLGTCAEHVAMHPLQLGTGLDTELLGKDGAGTQVGGERVRPPPRPVQREHQLCGEPFPQRVLDGKPAQVGYPRGVPGRRLG